MKSCSKPVSAADGSLFTSVRWPRSKPPKRAEALANLETLLPWADLEAIVRRAYFSDQRKTGRPGYPAAMMLRCLVVCWFWTLSDDRAEAVILDSYATARFVGTDPWKPRPPSASAIRE
ncbi:transposase, partial [Candidatus Accumulibacter aalborgensis]|uniref:transposase n=1 Tax=Candidatus Accumulibacter aalborgensis TaxID=1860102 RepID=UPI0016450B57